MLQWKKSADRNIGNMIELIICDDDAMSLNQTKQFLTGMMHMWHEEIEITTYTDSDSLMKRIQSENEQTDILLLDIDMPDISGLEVAEFICDEGRDIIVIFLTAHDEFVYMSFQYAPFRYIRKEYMKEELPSAMKAAVAKLSAQRSSSICLRTQEGELFVKIADITHFQTENRRVCVYMVRGGTYVIWKKLKDLKAEIDEKGGSFIYVHSGCVVNLRHVRTRRSGMVVLDGAQEIEIPVSRRRQREVSAKISDYWRDHS